MYEYMDKQVAKIIVLISKAFSNFNRTCKFDNLNDLSKDTKKLYQTLEKANLELFLDVAIHSYMLAYYEAQKLLSEANGTNAITKEEALERARKIINDKWIIDNLIDAYNPLTEYVYKREADRKRARYFESLVATMIIMEASKKASSIWVKQTSQYAIDSVYKAKVEAYKDSKIEKVRWITENDNRVCGECAELEGQEFEIDMLPDKPHINCRCDIEPIL